MATKSNLKTRIEGAKKRAELCLERFCVAVLESRWLNRIFWPAWIGALLYIIVPSVWKLTVR